MEVNFITIKNHIEMYSTHNEGKSVAERFIKTLKNKVYKHMTYIDLYWEKCLF